MMHGLFNILAVWSKLEDVELLRLCTFALSSSSICFLQWHELAFCFCTRSVEVKPAAVVSD